MPLKFEDNSTNPETNLDNLVFGNSKISPLELISSYLARMYSKFDQTPSEVDLVFYDSLEFRDSVENNNTENDLIFRDSQDNSVDFHTNSVLIDFFGQNLNLKKQNDTNQCGVCAILNTLEVLEIKHNWSVLAIRQWVLQNQVQRGFSKLENGYYFAKDGFGNYSNLPIDVNNFWLGQFDINDFLEQILIDSDFLIDKRFQHEINIEETEVIILNTGNHFVVCFQKSGNWYKIDSLQLGQNLLTKLDQNPLIIQHTSKIFFKKSVNLNFT
jgi:hypothetical protein